MTISEVEDFDTLGFVKVADQGFAMLLYGRPQGNTLYVARCSLPGDHNGLIEAFEPCDVEDIVWIPERRKRSASVGDRWLDVFVIRGEPYVGTSDQLWRVLSRKRRFLSDHLPLSLFDLAFNAGEAARFELAANARNFVKHTHGDEKSSRWAVTTFERALQLAIQKIVKLLPGELDGAVVRGVSKDLVHLELPSHIVTSLGTVSQILDYLADVLKLARSIGLTVDTSRIIAPELISGASAHIQLFKPGDYVVYPAHGVGRILGIERQNIATLDLEVFRIDFEHERMILEVPTTKARSSGMRELSSEEEVDEALMTLQQPARRIGRPGWMRRMQDRLKSGDLVTIASAARDLSEFAFDDNDEVGSDHNSASHLYKRAVELIAREIAIIDAISLPEARAMVVSARSDAQEGDD